MSDEDVEEIERVDVTGADEAPPVNHIPFSWPAGPVAPILDPPPLQHCFQYWGLVDRTPACPAQRVASGCVS